MNTLNAAVQRPPGRKSVRPFFGVLAPFRKDPPGFLLRNARQYGAGQKVETRAVIALRSRHTMNMIAERAVAESRRTQTPQAAR